MTSARTAQDAKVTDRAQPSQLVLLQEVKRLELGTKVRFMGCVEIFAVGSDIATFGCRSPGADHASLVLVNLEAVLGTLPSAALEVGSWLNIMGYVANLPDGWDSEMGRRRSSRKTKRSLPYVQAILAWETGEIDLAEYEDGVRDARGRPNAFA